MARVRGIGSYSDLIDFCSVMAHYVNAPPSININVREELTSNLSESKCPMLWLMKLMMNALKTGFRLITLVY